MFVEEIVDFSELGEFIYQPVKYYSLGMIARLAFSVVTAARPDILLIDEILAVGDASFQVKAKQRLSTMMDYAKICIIASHSDTLLSEMCTRSIELNKGTVVNVR